MFHEIEPIKLNNHFTDFAPEDADLILVLTGTGRKDDKVLMKKDADETIALPTLALIKACNPDADYTYRYLFSMDDARFFLLERAVPAVLPEGFAFEIGEFGGFVFVHRVPFWMI